MPTYPAITIWQPWASLIAAGAKRFEFRSWPAPNALWGKCIAIHAGARKMPNGEVRGLLAKLHGSAWRETGLLRDPAIKTLEQALQAPTLFPLSSIVCLAILGQPIRDQQLADELGLPHVNDSDRVEHSNWGWPLRDVQRLEPFQPVRGSQGWWTWRTPPVEVA